MPFQPTYDVPPLRHAYTMKTDPPKVGVLMLHGFMGSPLSSRAMNTYLHERGLTIHCPLLPGHGHWPDKFHKIPYKLWLAEAEEGLANLQPMVDEIFIMGHSMGVALTAHLLAQNPEKVKGIVMIAPIYDVPDPRIRWLKVLRYIVPWLPTQKIKKMRKVSHERVLDFYPDFDFDAPGADKLVAKIARLPSSGVDEMRKTLDYARGLWGQVKVPALLLQGGRDIAISARSGEIICEALASTDKTLKIYPEAGHELMRPASPFHQEVWEQVFEFISTRSDYL
jgi:carboxylesterase